MFLKDENKLKEAEKLDEEEEEEIEDKLKERCPPAFTHLIEGVSQHTMNDDLRTATLRVFNLLSTEAAVVAIIPYPHLEPIKTIMNKTLSNNDENVLELYTYVGFEIYDLVNRSIKTDWQAAVKEFILAMCDEVQMHFSPENLDNVYDDEDDTASCKPYDPQSGVAYYFRPDGNQIRTMPEYIMNEKKAKTRRPAKNHQPPECHKKYPMVTRGGYSNVFLFFCPIHGHCYGFHIIPGSEGRKDPFSALYKYKPTPPEHLFYDFACQFNEYALNRAPEYFKDCRCWHDIFHSFNHTCGDTFKSKRMPQVAANTEICEQFNSYLQRFKWTCTHLGQERFCFMLQYAIYKWNIKQTKRIQKTRADLEKIIS